MNSQQQTFTMSSREIAHLCEKQHKHVLRDIENMIQDIAGPKFGLSDFLSSYTDRTGRKLKEYRLPKDLTVTLITGYRAEGEAGPLVGVVLGGLCKRLDSAGPFRLEPRSIWADCRHSLQARKPRSSTLKRTLE
jgi:hypothetical protein